MATLIMPTGRTSTTKSMVPEDPEIILMTHWLLETMIHHLFSTTRKFSHTTTSEALAKQGSMTKWLRTKLKGFAKRRKTEKDVRGKLKTKPGGREKLNKMRKDAGRLKL